MQYSQNNSKGVKYFLHRKEVILANGGKSIAYYFSKGQNPEFALEAIPEGYEVMEGERSHLPFLKKITPTTN